MKIIYKRIRNVQQFIPLPFNFFSTQHTSHLKHRFFINIMIMQTKREGYNYLQVPAQYRIHTYITKDSQTTQSKRYTVGNLQLKIISTHSTTLRECRVLNSWFIAFINNLRLPYNICACMKSSF